MFTNIYNKTKPGFSAQLPRAHEELRQVPLSNAVSVHSYAAVLVRGQ